MANNDIKILAFLCLKWGYGGADMAGTIRAQYPTSLRTVLVPCTGRVGVDLVMRAFGRGADGVLIAGWYPKECDYETGNYFAYRLVEYLKEVVKAIGINPERIKMTFCSSAEGAKFQRIATEFDKLIRELGPNPLRIKSGTQEKAKVKAKA
jgi:F420-non-reducing hydrogenase iron-sulfur subunit